MVKLWGADVAQDSRGVEGRSQGKATAQVMAVQTSSALLSGLTAATLTNPLDVIKTRLQVLHPTASIFRMSCPLPGKQQLAEVACPSAPCKLKISPNCWQRFHSGTTESFSAMRLINPTRARLALRCSPRSCLDSSGFSWQLLIF